MFTPPELTYDLNGTEYTFVAGLNVYAWLQEMMVQEPHRFYFSPKDEEKSGGRIIRNEENILDMISVMGKKKAP